LLKTLKARSLNPISKSAIPTSQEQEFYLLSDIKVSTITKSKLQNFETMTIMQAYILSLHTFKPFSHVLLH